MPVRIVKISEVYNGQIFSQGPKDNQRVFMKTVEFFTGDFFPRDEDFGPGTKDEYNCICLTGMYVGSPCYFFEDESVSISECFPASVLQQETAHSVSSFDDCDGGQDDGIWVNVPDVNNK